jgi:ABC-type Fe3+-hydroxamate transport system substrate-binding protein
VAKLSLKQREEKREKLVAKYAKKYAELKAVADDAKRPTKSVTPPAWSCRSCRAMPTRPACATVAS